MTTTAPTEQAFDLDTEVVAYERSPLDVFRALVFAVAAVVVAFLTRYLRAGMDGFEEGISSLMSVDVRAIRLTLDAMLISATVLTTLVVLIVPLVTRRWRLFGYVFTANLLAALVIAAINAWVGDLDGTAAVGAGTDALAVDASTDVAAATQIVAAFLAIAPFVSGRWRRAGAWLVAVMMVLRLAVASGVSTHSLLVLTVGGAVGSAVLVAYGRPTTQPRMATILEALRSSGLDVATLERASVDARGSVPWFATLKGGQGLFVKVLGTDQRAADLLFRIYRMLRLRNVGDERPFSSLRRTVEHEALVALSARDVGVRTPRMRAMSAVGRDGFLLAYDMIDGASLDNVDPDLLTDEVLLGIWEQVALLQQHRIAHRDLRLANVFLSSGNLPASSDGGPEPSDGRPASAAEPWLIDFGFSEIAADDTLLRADVAQLLASLALVVGTTRAVEPAVAALGTEAVSGSLTRLQPAALSGSTQSALKGDKGLLEELRAEIERRCSVGQIELEPVTRFTGKQIFTLVMLVGIVYFLAPQFADLSGIFDEISGADWTWLVPMLIATAATFLAAGFAVMGSVRSPLPAIPTFAAQLGSSFAAKVAPAGLGGMALNVRYLQKRGLDTELATSAVGLRAVAGIVGHLSLTLVFLFWAANDRESVAIPSPMALLFGLAVVVVVGALAMLVPATRRLVLDRLLPILAEANNGLREVLTSPMKLFMLFGGSALVTFSYVVAFYAATQAFNIPEHFAALAAVYLVGAAVASAAPTPGGLGAVEAALIAGLIAIGADGVAAIPAVFLFRIATFWLPILPGWGAFNWLRRTQRL